MRKWEVYLKTIDVYGPNTTQKFQKYSSKISFCIVEKSNCAKKAEIRFVQDTVICVCAVAKKEPFLFRSIAPACICLVLYDDYFIVI